MNLLEKHKVKHVVLKADGHDQMVELLEPVTVYKKLIDFKNWRGLNLGERRKHMYVATLVIPAGTVIHCRVRCSHFGENKCRAEFAIVKDIKDIDGKRVKEVKHCPLTLFKTNPVSYKINDFVFPDKFSTKLETCAAGIHFFFTKKEAENY